MNELNEKLAVEVMGALKGFRNVARRDEYGNFIQVPTYATYALPGGKVILQSEWNPTADLNQLKMCYEALNQEQKAIYKQLVIDHDIQSVFDAPEQHAELILKAKGVS